MGVLGEQAARPTARERIHITEKDTARDVVTDIFVHQVAEPRTMSSTYAYVVPGQQYFVRRIPRRVVSTQGGATGANSAKRARAANAGDPLAPDDGNAVVV